MNNETLDATVVEYQLIHEQYVTGLLTINDSQTWLSLEAKKLLEPDSKNSPDIEALRELINRLDRNEKLSVPELLSTFERLSHAHYFKLVGLMASRPEASDDHTRRLAQQLKDIAAQVFAPCSERARAIFARSSDLFRKEPNAFTSLFFFALSRAMRQWDIKCGNIFINYFVGAVRRAMVDDAEDQDLIRRPHQDAADRKRLLDETKRFERVEGRHPTVQELAANLKLSPIRIQTLQAQMASPISLDASSSDDPDERPLHEAISSQLSNDDKTQEVEAEIKKEVAIFLAAKRPAGPAPEFPFDDWNDRGLILMHLPAELIPTVVKSRSRTIPEALAVLTLVGFQDIKAVLEEEKKLI